MDSILSSDDFDRLPMVDLVREVKDFALVNGVTLRTKNENDDDIVQLAPVTAFPSMFPKKAFDYAKFIQKPMNVLMHNVANDVTFLNDSLQDTIRVDDFTKRLLEMNNKMEQIGRSQDLYFGLFRTDYMVNDPNGDRILQVESNSISSGFAALGPKVSHIHRNIVSRYLPHVDLQRLPNNKANVEFPSCFIKAFEAYGNPKAVILFVVEDRTINLCDQRHLEFEIIRQNPLVQVVRRSFTSLHRVAKLTEDKKLFIDGDREVGLVYYRYCYDPSHYSSDESWNLRLKIEMSRAIKCPSINYHLSGVKKIQQVLTNRDILEKFVSKQEADLLLPTFAQFHGLERNESGDKAIDIILKNPQDYVMKPQREGGGHNIYGTDIPPFLNNIRHSDEREGYIVMEMIRPPVLQNIIVEYANGKQFKPQMISITGELGIFGSILGSKDHIVFNEECGHVLRSKKLGVNEGGISAGFGAVDSPILY